MLVSLTIRVKELLLLLLLCCCCCCCWGVRREHRGRGVLEAVVGALLILQLVDGALAAVNKRVCLVWVVVWVQLAAEGWPGVGVCACVVKGDGGWELVGQGFVLALVTVH